MNNNDNNNMNFNPFTGEPLVMPSLDDMRQDLDNTTVNTMAEEPIAMPSLDNMHQENLNTLNEMSYQAPIQNIETTQIDPMQETYIQRELENIPTVDQSEEKFINNVQTINQEKKEEKKEGINFIFIIVLFALLLAAVLVLFPFLLKYV